MEITLSEAERAELVRRTQLPHRRSAEKARIILACADGMSNAGVARVVGVQAKTVGKWRRAFAAERMAGLEDAGWIGRPKADLVLDDAERRQLTQWARRAKTAQFLALRAKIVLRCAEGGTNQQAAADLGIDRSTVDRWRARFIAKRCVLARDRLQGGHDDLLDLVEEDRRRPARARLVMQAIEASRLSGRTIETLYKDRQKQKRSGRSDGPWSSNVGRKAAWRGHPDGPRPGRAADP
ncbi:helix-turn-helix domain-containing protein [Streptomyces sp. 2A115]|uniref:helix-turn-helix domain-containing protein n=1 Tax=Streptomyces sp. 2A115 TaxID=3457439 RepID=UPI003FD62358